MAKITNVITKSTENIQGVDKNVFLVILVLVACTIIMEIVKYVKVIAARLSSTKKVLRNKLWHMLAGKNTGSSAFGGLALQALPQTSHAWETTQDRSFLVTGQSPGRKRF